MTNQLLPVFDRVPQQVPSIVTLIAISTLMPLSLSVYLPSLPDMVTAFDTSNTMVQLTISVFLAAMALGQIVVGPLSDRYGRRPVILAGTALYILGSALCVVAPTIEILILARAIQAVGSCAGVSLGRAIVRDIYNREEAASAIGYVTMGMTVGPLLAPVIGGVLDKSFGWQGGFYLMLILGIGVFLLAWINLHETNHQKSAQSGFSSLWKTYGKLVEEPQFWAFALIAAFTSSVYFAYLGGVPYYAAEELGLTPVEMGVYFMFVAAGYIIGNGISGRISARVGILRMMMIGSSLPTSAIIFLVFNHWFDGGQMSALMLFTPMFVVGLGNGICLPSALSGSVSVRPGVTGAASGLTGTFQIALGGVTSTLAAWFMSDAMWPGTLWPMTILMALSMIVTWAAVIGAFFLETRTVLSEE